MHLNISMSVAAATRLKRIGEYFHGSRCSTIIWKIFRAHWSHRMKETYAISSSLNRYISTDGDYHCFGLGPTDRHLIVSVFVV